MSITARPVTADELFDLPDDGLRRELVRGEVIRMNPSGGEHGAIAAELLGELSEHVRAKKLGRLFGAETGFILTRNPDTVRAPDVAFVRQARIAEIGIPKGYFPAAPDLAVEVVSPGDRFVEVDAKVEDWLAHGAQLVWVVNPDRRTVAVHRSNRDVHVLGPDDVLEAPELFPGWQLVVAEIFRPA